MKLSCIAILLMAALSVCRKDRAQIQPVAAFTIFSDTSKSVFTLASGDIYSVNNQTTGSDYCQWDFGNGTTSDLFDIGISYPKAGLYTLKLTAFAVNANKSVFSKKIKVLDRYVKQIVINSLNWNAPGIRPSAAPPVTKANVWVEIVQCDSGKNYPFLPIGTFDAPVIYKSPIRSNVDSTLTPLLFDVPGDVRLDVAILDRSFGYRGAGYGFNLYEQDASGTYIVCSNFWSGTGITLEVEVFQPIRLPFQLKYLATGLHWFAIINNYCFSGFTQYRQHSDTLVNTGEFCQQGRFAYPLLNHRRRFFTFSVRPAGCIIAK